MEQSAYLLARYTAYATQRQREADTDVDFDPWIHPQNGHIPPCTVCHRDYTAKVPPSHPRVCLWYDFYAWLRSGKVAPKAW